MNSKFKYYLQIFLLILDFSILNISFLLSFLLNQILFTKSSLFTFSFLITLNFYYFILSLIFLNYAKKIIIDFTLFLKKSLQVYALWVFFMTFNFFLSDYSKNNFFSYFFIIVFFLIGLFFNRFLYLGIKNYFKEKDFLTNRILILGFNNLSEHLVKRIEEDSINNHIVGFIEDSQNVKELSHYPILSGFNDLMLIAKRYSINEIYSTISPTQNTIIAKCINQSEKLCIRFKFVPNLQLYLDKPTKVQFLNDLPILSLHLEPLQDIGNKVLKRCLDLFISSFVLIFVLSWLFPFLAVLIKISSKGPILFIQKRSGKNNSIFDCYKFRTMYLNKDSNTIQATKNDVRVTPIGHFLRKYNLDEFPQFYNVFRGEMSIIGPRPHMIKHTIEYSKIVKEYMTRLYLKPGITGWSQVNGLRGEITNDLQLHRRIKNDIWYLENWSIGLDLKIIYLTIYRIFKGDKYAY